MITNALINIQKKFNAIPNFKSQVQEESVRHLFTKLLPETIPVLFGILLLLLPYVISDQKLIEDWNSATYALYFSSPRFLFLFVPGAILAFFLTKKFMGERFLVPLMFCVSLTFYASWGIKFVPILIASITFNFMMRQLLCSSQPFWIKQKKRVLITTVTINLMMLGVFKYADFLITATNQFTGLQLEMLNLFLPFGISFFTFQEITLAVDTYRGAYKGGFLKYILFVSFFPHLVAGPLVHHREMMPQFSQFQLKTYNMVVGLGLLTLGLFKKVVIADSLSPFVKVVFDTDPTQSFSFLAAWTGALAYTFQIYFDFSGYSDMALGLARLFGVRLPINFNAPYKAYNIIDFWRRWHITLSRFLREYLYFPLGGNRAGSFRRYINLVIVMLLGGLWHGANWTFVIWGALHGAFLVINHGWQSICSKFPKFLPSPPIILSQLITFLCVVIAWVPFRSASIEKTIVIWKGMMDFNNLEWKIPSIGLNEIILALDQLQIPSGSEKLLFIGILFMLYLFCLITPTSHQIMRLKQVVPGQKHFEPRPRFFCWRVNVFWSMFMGLLFGFTILAGRQSVSEFLYWSF